MCCVFVKLFEKNNAVLSALALVATVLMVAFIGVASTVIAYRFYS